MFSPSLRLALAVVLLGACSALGSPRATAGVVRVVAAENFWGSIAQQVGGSHVQVTSIISDPTADPHLYESDAHDASAVADAQLVIENGLGYDTFVDQLLSASSARGRVVISAAEVLHVRGSAADPHLWYDVPRVHLVVSAIAAQLAALDPADKLTFSKNAATFDKSLGPVLDALHAISTRHTGAAVAYTERVPAYLFAAAGLVVKTPPGFARAIEDGQEPSPGDTHAMEQLMSSRAVRVLVYNAQATSSSTEHIRDLARGNGIPVVAVTETMPRNTNYQAWQLAQTRQLLAALGA